MVSVAWSTARMPGPLPTVIAARAWQPDVLVPLQVAELITETVSSAVTYRVWVLWLSAMPGPPPAAIVAGTSPQPEVTCALQADALITETEPSPLFATYTVCVAGSVITPVGLAPTWTVVWGG